jgi:anaerobic selenocysteine-containing dehydrogenase
MSRDGLVAEWLRWVLLALTGSLDTPNGMTFHRGTAFALRKPRRPPESAPVASRPELRHWISQDPCVAFADEVASGALRALVVGGANPISAFPDPRATTRALESLDTLAVVDVFANDTTARATHVLPATGQLERADIPMHELVAARSGTFYTPAVVPAAAQRRPAWWVFTELARRMTGADLFGMPAADLDADGVFALLTARSPIPWNAIRAAGPHGVAVATEVGWVRDTLRDGAPWAIAPPPLVERLRCLPDPEPGLVLIPRRRMRANNSVEDPNDPDREPLATLHPLDAATYGIVDGATVRVESQHGSMELLVAIDDAVRPGALSVSHGRRGASPGQVVSADTEVDSLTGMPRASGVPVTITPG